MIRIQIPNNFFFERKYIISTLLGYFLGLKYKIESHKKDNYTIILENKKKLIIKDFFLNSKSNNYLSSYNLPKRPLSTTNHRFLVDKNLPIIYGANKLQTSNNKIICEIDIFASSFFMLTRWEEYVNKKRDKYNRFPAKESLAYKEKFLDRPVVNEYTEMLWNMLKFLGINQKRKERKFTVCLTHDVDEIDRYKWYPPLGAIKRSVKSFDLKKSIDILIDYTKVWLHLKTNPYRKALDRYIINLEKKYGFKSSFYFMTSNERYSLANPWLHKFIEKLKKDNFEIGIHPSFNAYNNPEIIREEKQKLENVASQKIIGGRQHYLKWKIPRSWRAWSSAGLKYDTTLSYHDHEGFRCGACYPFQPFDIIKKRQINIWEIPLTVMDCSLINYRKLNPNKSLKIMTDLLNTTKRYNGIFVLLWHNSYMTRLFTDEWKKCFEEFYRLISQRNCAVLPVKETIKQWTTSS